jgi:hypothetical protein
VSREFKAVAIHDWLEIELTPADESKRAPLITGLEIIRTADLAGPKPLSYRYPPTWPEGKPEMVLEAVADSRVARQNPGRSEGGNITLLMDGGQETMNDEAYSMLYLKFDLSAVPGKPLGVKLRLQCLCPGSAEAGEIVRCGNDWRENEITFDQSPASGRRVATLGRVKEREQIERSLALGEIGREELSLLLRPTSTDGIYFESRESENPPELVVVYEPE